MGTVRVETEAKFVIPDASVLEGLKEITQLDGFQLEPIGTDQMVDRYLDTAGRHIYRAGYACRIRMSGDKQLLTLKSLTPAEGTLHRRQEIEQEVETDQPDAWSDGEAKALVLEIIGPAPLETLFTVHQVRHQYYARREEQLILEFSLDEVSFDDPETIDYYGLEAELKGSGTEADLVQFIESLQEKWLLQPDSLSKFERGLANLNQQQEGNAGEQLSETERIVVTQIAGMDNKHLSRRGMIILMSEVGISAVDIAGELELTARTVRHWQKEFQENRLAIFPEALVSQFTAQETAAEGESSEPAVKSSSKKGKRKKEKNLISFPGREQIGLEPTDTMAEAGRKVIGFHFARMLQHEPGTRLGEDVEELHDMRVATRRMRAALRVFGQSFSKKKIKPIRTGLKETGRALGPARDMDVFMAKLGQYQRSLPEAERAAFDPLLTTWRSEGEKSRRKMVTYLESKAYAKFKQKMLKFVETEGLAAKPIPTDVPVAFQLRHIVPRLIYTRYEAVGAYEAVLENAPIETLHSLRIAFKRFRYTLEYFQELLGPEVTTVIKELKVMQDHLGDLNDADVASQILRRFLAEWEEQQLDKPLAERQSPTQIVAYLTAKLEERHRLMVTFPEAWANFNRPEVRRNLALALAAL
jgi:CHAD domain-containing protein